MSCFCEVWVWCDAINKISFLGQWHTKTLNRSGTFAFRGLKTDCISVWLATCLACTINVLSTNLRNFPCFIIHMLLDIHLLLNSYDSGVFIYLACLFFYKLLIKDVKILELDIMMNFKGIVSRVSLKLCFISEWLVGL